MLTGSEPLVTLQAPPKRGIVRKRGPPAALQIHTPARDQPISANLAQSAHTSSLSSAASEASADFPFGKPALAKPRSLRNMRNLSLALPSAASSTNSLCIPHPDPIIASTIPSSRPTIDTTSRSRSSSIASLAGSTTTTAVLAHRRDEDGGSPTIPYSQGPIEILPGIWLGSEDNARDFEVMGRLGIKAVLNVAKEVASPFEDGNHAEMSYLKMNWSHGQADLIKEGFPAAMAFVDDAQGRGEGVLIHCQCGISRSGTMVIALVMRAAANSSPAVPVEVHGLKGMHAAYAYVKKKSRWVGPNMSLIYQLLEYEKTFNSEATSPTESDRASSIAEDEAEWSKRRAALDEMSEDDDERESLAIRREAEALDKAMEDRLLARKASNSSIGSAGVVGAVPAWKQRYGQRRRRMGSLASMTSIRSSSSVLSENLVEEDEEAELLGLGSANENRSMGGSRSPSIAPEESPLDPPSEPAPLTARPAAMRFAAPPMSAAPTKTSFSIPPPPMSAAPTRTSFNIPPSPITAIRASFDLDSTPRPRTKRRPAPLVSMLPPVPSSPDVPEAVEEAQAARAPASLPAEPSPVAAVAPPPLRRTRTEAGRPTPPPLYLRTAPKGSRLSSVPPSSGPSQTLFVFPPSPKDRDTASQSRTPAAMTLMSHLQQVPFPSVASPRVASFQKAGRMRSYVALGVPATPTTACSLVDARGWFGADA